jgi:methionyl-tRNA formyltransferase
MVDAAGSPGTLLDPAGLVACGAGAVRLLQVQPAGKQAMTAEEFLRGRRPGVGTKL